MARTMLSEVRGTLNQINDVLAGDNGAEWLDRLKRLMRGELVVKMFKTWRQWFDNRLWQNVDEVDKKIQDAGMHYLYPWISRTVALAIPLRYIRCGYCAKVHLVVLSLKEMGFLSGYASIREVIDQAEALGLRKCPSTLAVDIRLAWKDQPTDNHVYICMEPVVSGLHENEEPGCVFSVENRDGKLYLGVQYEATDNRQVFAPTDRFVFEVSGLLELREDR